MRVPSGETDGKLNLTNSAFAGGGMAKRVTAASRRLPAEVHDAQRGKPDQQNARDGPRQPGPLGCGHANLRRRVI